MINDYTSYLKNNFRKWSRFLNYILETTDDSKFHSAEHKKEFRTIMWEYRDYVYNLHQIHPSYTSGVSQFTKQLQLTNTLFTYCDRMANLGDTIPSAERTKWAKTLNEAMDDFFEKELMRVIPQEEKTYYSRLALDKDADLTHHLSSRYNAIREKENGIERYTTTSTGLG
jgi:hypothetical protein